MENTQFGLYGQEDPTSTFSHENDSVNDVNSNYGNAFPTADFYDEGGNYKSDAFENLGSLHYMNYLHSHDDML